MLFGNFGRASIKSLKLLFLFAARFILNFVVHNYCGILFAHINTDKNIRDFFSYNCIITSTGFWSLESRDSQNPDPPPKNPLKVQSPDFSTVSINSLSVTYYVSHNASLSPAPRASAPPPNPSLIVAAPGGLPRLDQGSLALMVLGGWSAGSAGGP